MIGFSGDRRATSTNPAVGAGPAIERSRRTRRAATSTGYVSTFAAAGFVEVARRSPEEPIMRYTFTE